MYIRAEQHAEILDIRLSIYMFHLEQLADELKAGLKTFVVKVYGASPSP